MENLWHIDRNGSYPLLSDLLFWNQRKRLILKGLIVTWNNPLLCVEREIAIFAYRTSTTKRMIESSISPYSCVCSKSIWKWKRKDPLFVFHPYRIWTDDLRLTYHGLTLPLSEKGLFVWFNFWLNKPLATMSCVSIISRNEKNVHKWVLSTVWFRNEKEDWLLYSV